MANYFKVYKMDNRILKVYCPTDPYFYIVLNNGLTYSDDFFTSSVVRCFEDFKIKFKDSYHPTVDTRADAHIQQSFDDYYFPRLITYMNMSNDNQLKMESLFSSITQLDFKSNTNFDMYVPIETSRRNIILNWKDKTIGDIKGIKMKDLFATIMYYDNTPYVGNVDLSANEFGVNYTDDYRLNSLIEMNKMDTGLQIENNSFTVCYVDFKDIGANLAVDIDKDLVRVETTLTSEVSNKIKTESMTRIIANASITNSLPNVCLDEIVSSIVKLDLDNKLNIGDEATISGERKKFIREIKNLTIGELKNKTMKELTNELI